jgi:hypothetical protein
LPSPSRWNRGDSWRDALRKGLHLLDPDRHEMVSLILERALADIGAQLEGFPMRLA